LAGFLHCTVETRWLGSGFLMFYRNNAGRLGSGFISVCLETRWLGQKSGPGSVLNKKLARKMAEMDFSDG